MFDYNNIDLKKEIEELNKLEGKERGQDILYLVRYAKMKFSEEGHQRVVDELQKYDWKLPDLKKIDPMEWISASIPTIYMVAMTKVFNWDADDLYNMGRKLLSVSQTLKLFIRYFLSPQKTIEKAAANWRKHYTFGQMDVQFDEGRNQFALHLKDFKKHKVTCDYMRGVYAEIMSVAAGGKPVVIKETQCMFEGAPYHEFKIKWEE